MKFFVCPICQATQFIPKGEIAEVFHVASLSEPEVIEHLKIDMADAKKEAEKN
jgi:hypothetical protein